MSDDPTKVAGVVGASTGSVVTVEAVVIKADGRRVDYGTIASSDPERVPVSPRPEEK
jgi:predicted thioesterase